MAPLVNRHEPTSRCPAGRVQAWTRDDGADQPLRPSTAILRTQRLPSWILAAHGGTATARPSTGGAPRAAEACAFHVHRNLRRDGGYGYW